MFVIRLAKLLFALDPTLFFVLLFAPPGPLWCHINTVFLFLVTLLFVLVYSRRFMFRLLRVSHLVRKLTSCILGRVQNTKDGDR